MASNFEVVGKVSLKDETKEGLNSAKQGFAGLQEAAVNAAAAIGSALALREVVNFGKDIFSSFSEAESAMLSFESTLDNVKGTTDEMREALVNAGKQAIQFGVDDELATTQLGVFYARTKDVNAALDLHQLALNIAAQKNKTYEEASMAVTQALNGTSKALKIMGFDIDENSSAVQTLGKVSESTFGAAAAKMESAKVQAEKLTREWENMKESLGAALSQVLLPFVKILSAIFDWYTNLNPQIQKFIGIIVTTAIVTAGLATIIIGSMAAWGALTAAVAALGITLSIAFGWLTAIGLIVGTVVAGVAYFSGSAAKANVETSELNRTTSDLVKSLTGVNDGSLATSASMKQLANESKKATEDIKKLRDEMQKTAEEGAKKQSELNTSAAQAIIDQEKKIKDLKQQLQDSYTGDVQRAADEHVKINELAKTKQQADLEDQIEVESAALNKFNFLKKDLDKEYTAAKLESQKTEFEQRLNAINLQKIQAAQETENKLKEQQKQLLDLRKHLAEIKTEESKNTQFIAEEQNKQTQGWNAVGAARIRALSGTYSNSTSATSGQSFSSIPSPFMTNAPLSFSAIPKLASGGSVNKGGAYIVGENGPELFSPNTNGSIIPNQGGVTVNIFNPALLDDTMVDKVSQQIARNLGRDLRY